MCSVQTFVVLLITVFAFNGVKSCNPRGHSNGCSIPGGWPYFYKDVFKPDCDKHDICYACGQYKGVSRSTCDSRFWENLKRRCRTDGQVKNQLWCNMVTADYYLAVRVGGNAHYAATSPSWCRESWVSGCMI